MHNKFRIQKINIHIKKVISIPKSKKKDKYYWDREYKKCVTDSVFNQP